MIKLGEVQKLIIKRFASVGAYLNVEDESDDDVLLPKSQVPDNAKIGDEIEVMIYNDSKDRIIATTNRSKLQVGEMGHLTVISQTKIGSFLDWGLEKDLFLPFAETVGKVEKDKQYLVGVYLDKSDRICATMKVRDMLSTDSPYKENDKVKGTIYSINRDIGAFVAVDDKYDGLIPKEELIGAYEVGEIIEVRVTGVKPDGKLDLSFRNRSYIQRDEDSETILSNLKINSGFLPLNDKSDAEDIRKQLGMSKSAFKKAVGKLYKEKTIIIKDNGIELK
jgi:predicted RNA-binding protein (virulence factor B family)